MVFSKATGEFCHADVVEHMARIARHPDFRPEFHQLMDGRDIARVDLSGDEVQDLASRTIFSAHSKRAIVVANDHDFGIARMFGTYREIRGKEDIRSFKNMPDALAWLGLSAEPDPKLFPLLNPPAKKD